MAAEFDLETVRAARAELGGVIAQIRDEPGFGGFLAPSRFEDVARAATCPMIYLAAAGPGGVALIVQGHQVTQVLLAQLTDDELRRRVTDHLSAYQEYQDDPAARRADWNTALDGLTGWLWDAVMGPVLARLPAATAQIVLVGGGLLGFVPLHAAWTPDQARPSGRRYALDLTAISYAPNARSLGIAQQLAARISPRRLLAVVEPLPVSAGPLPSAATETLAALAAFPAEPVVLRGNQATPPAFWTAARHADVLHLACHGFANLDSPLDSGVLLAGNRPVSLRDLIASELQVRLAVLSACETGLPGAELPDEVISLPAGLLQAGVAGVVAAQWSVPDRPTAMLMTEFYRRWHWEQQQPATALGHAQQWLRDSTNAEKTAHFEAARSGAEWLPLAAAEEFLDHLDAAEPGRRDHADIHAWGAFAHFGA